MIGVGRAVRLCANGIIFAAVLSFIFGALPLRAQQIPASAYQEMRWRNVGPYRAGRTRALAGVPSQPNVFYMGGVDSGVWKSDDYGETWTPIFDDQPPAPSARSRWLILIRILFMSDAVKDCRAPISPSATECTNPPTREKPGRILVFATRNKSREYRDRSERSESTFSLPCLAIRYGANAERGIYRSTDGGAEFSQKFLDATTIPAATMWKSIQRIQIFFSRRFGPRGKVRGKTPTLTTKLADFLNPPTAAQPGIL